MFRQLQRRFFSVDGFGRVPIGNKIDKLVKELQIGDEILTPFGNAKILEINMTPVSFGYAELVELNRMLISPTHPIKIYDEWLLPKEVKKPKLTKCYILYSFKLDNHHIMTINGNNIATIGNYPL